MVTVTHDQSNLLQLLRLTTTLILFSTSGSWLWYSSLPPTKGWSDLPRSHWFAVLIEHRYSALRLDRLIMLTLIVHSFLDLWFVRSPRTTVTATHEQTDLLWLVRLTTSLIICNLTKVWSNLLWFLSFAMIPSICSSDSVLWLWLAVSLIHCDNSDPQTITPTKDWSDTLRSSSVTVMIQYGYSDLQLVWFIVVIQAYV